MSLEFPELISTYVTQCKGLYNGGWSSKEFSILNKLTNSGKCALSTELRASTRGFNGSVLIQENCDLGSQSDLLSRCFSKKI